MTSYARGQIVVPAWVDDYEVKPIVDANGNISIVVATIDDTIDNHNMLYDGTTWVNEKLTFGYTYTYYEYKMTVVSAGGTGTNTLTTVPSGEIWVIKGGSMMHNDSVARTMAMFVYSGYGYRIWQENSATGGVWYTNVFEPVMKEDEYAYQEAWALTAGTRLYAVLFGYKMDIT